MGQVALCLAQKSVSLTTLRSRSDGIRSACLDGNRCNWLLVQTGADLVQPCYSCSVGYTVIEGKSKNQNYSCFLKIVTFTCRNQIWTGLVVPECTPSIYAAKLLFHRSPTRHSDYTVTGQCSHS